MPRPSRHRSIYFVPLCRIVQSLLPLVFRWKNRLSRGTVFRYYTVPLELSFRGPRFDRFIYHSPPPSPTPRSKPIRVSEIIVARLIARNRVDFLARENTYGNTRARAFARTTRGEWGMVPDYRFYGKLISLRGDASPVFTSDSRQVGTYGRDSIRL